MDADAQMQDERGLQGPPPRWAHRIDLVGYPVVIVEVKARAVTGPGEEAQALNYLAATGRQVALLLNVGGSRLDDRRSVLSKTRIHKP